MKANSWWADFPQNRDSFINKLSDGKSSEQVETDLIALVEAQFGAQPAVLAGNSIHNDRGFIRRWWPALDLKLHYRMLDVSSFKVLFQGKFGVAMINRKSTGHMRYSSQYCRAAVLFRLV